MFLSERLITLPRRVEPQPTPMLNDVGDCGACVLAGLLSITVQDVYTMFWQGKPRSLGWTEMRASLEMALSEGLLDRISITIPIWPYEEPEWHNAFGLTSGRQVTGWLERLVMGLDGGYYGIANVDSSKSGPTGHWPDHWVMICGFRHNPESHTPNEILVSCSSRSTPDEEWVPAQEFLSRRGGFNLLLARPTL